MDAGKDGSGKREPSDDGLGDGEAPNKRPRNSGGGRAVDVRFLLQSRNAGAIIGKGGANINSLRKEVSAWHDRLPCMRDKPLPNSTLIGIPHGRCSLSATETVRVARSVVLPGVDERLSESGSLWKR